MLRVGRFEEKSISRIVAVLSVVAAAVLLLGSITALYFAQSPVVKLVLVYIFTAAFAICVALMTNARRAELFAATAA